MGLLRQLGLEERASEEKGLQRREKSRPGFPTKYLSVKECRAKERSQAESR